MGNNKISIKKNIKFGILGAAGYISKRHVQTIKNLGHDLVIACDINENVGYLDGFFPNCEFVKKENIFFSRIKKMKVEYVVICTPNYLHLKQIINSLNQGCKVICEKPLVITKKDFNKLLTLSEDKKNKINVILQLRLNSTLSKIRKYIKNLKKPFKSNLNYVTPRGKWYENTWKINNKLSGGIKLNIGVHLFDILIIIFKSNFKVLSFRNSSRKCSGKILFNQITNLTFNLSINKKDLPKKNISSYRVLKINKKNFDLSKSFQNLHEKSYKNILVGNGFKVNDLKDTYNLIHKLKY